MDGAGYFAVPRDAAAPGIRSPSFASLIISPRYRTGYDPGAVCECDPHDDPLVESAPPDTSQRSFAASLHLIWLSLSWYMRFVSPHGAYPIHLFIWPRLFCSTAPLDITSPPLMSGRMHVACQSSLTLSRGACSFYLFIALPLHYAMSVNPLSFTPYAFRMPAQFAHSIGKSCGPFYRRTLSARNPIARTHSSGRSCIFIVYKASLTSDIP